MKATITCLLLTAAFCTASANAAEPDPAKREAEVQKDIDSIVSTCEKKKLPAEQEVECIEQGFLQLLGEAPRNGS